MLVEYNKPNIHDAYGMKFIPGMNNVPVERWERAKQDPEIQRFIEEKVMVEVMPDEGKKEPSDEIPDLGKFQVKNALKVAQRTFIPEMLRKWKYSDKRPEVIETLDKQLTALEKKGK